MRVLKDKRVLVMVTLLVGVFFLLRDLLVVKYVGNNTMIEQMVIDEEVTADRAELESLNDFHKYVEFLSDLAKTKGAVHAYAVLRDAKLVAGTDYHLVAHEIGDILYKQAGVEGMQYCTHDFRNACSHSIVIGAFIDQGNEAISMIVDACKQAPGGSGSYNMCFHGLGHGVLAYVDYDFQAGVDICRSFDDIGGGNEGSECVGGMVMEILSGGAHDQEAWSKQRARYLDEKKPLALCVNDYLDDKYVPTCVTYLTPYFFQLSARYLEYGQDVRFKEAFSYCEPSIGTNYEQYCYSGFGKEFAVIARDYDVTSFELATDEEMETVYRWCKLAGTDDHIRLCVREAISSIYWGGENSYVGALKFCDVMSGDMEDYCNGQLIEVVAYYAVQGSIREQFCVDIKSEYEDQCRSRLF